MFQDLFYSILQNDVYITYLGRHCVMAVANLPFSIGLSEEIDKEINKNHTVDTNMNDSGG